MGRVAGIRWRLELCCLVAATVATYAIASALELNELFNHWVLHYEHWQLDEVPLTATVFACGLSWFAMRRRSEAEAALRLREAAEERAGELLAHNRELAQQLIALQENERLSLARELHDEFGQRCSAIRAEAAWIRGCVRRPVAVGAGADAGGAQADRSGLMAASDRIDEAAQQLHVSVRDMLRRLRPANLDTLGLVAALQELCEAWEERSGVSCVFHHDGLHGPLGATLDITVYRVTQEALTNVVRHAQASAVRVALSCRAGDALCLSIQDDGRGMDVDATTHGLGLLGAHERASALGGCLRLASPAGRGLRLELTLPLPDGMPPPAHLAAAMPAAAPLPAPERAAA